MGYIVIDDGASGRSWAVHPGKILDPRHWRFVRKLIHPSGEKHLIQIAEATSETKPITLRILRRQVSSRKDQHRDRQMTRLSFTQVITSKDEVLPTVNHTAALGELCATFSMSSIIRGAHAREVRALIDPKPLTRQAITARLAKALPDWMIIGAANCEQFGEAAEPHLFIIYVRSMSVTDSWAQNELQLIKLRFPNSLITVLSDRENADDVIGARIAGVSGYLSTSSPFEVLIAALVLIDAGGTYIPALTLRSPTAMLNDEKNGKQPAALDHLTASERSVLALLREGKPNKLIALQMNIQESTVKVHVRNILRKLGASNRTHAAAIIDRLMLQPRDRRPRV